MLQDLPEKQYTAKKTHIGYYAAFWPYLPFQYEITVDANTLY